jgi:hypothetical protein
MEIVSVELSHKSYIWANGLYIVVGIDNDKDVYNLCRLDKTGNPELGVDGNFSISNTSLNNGEIKKTNLHYLTPKELRKQKLKEINENKI